MPNKSPIPIKAKDIFSFNKLFNSNNKYLHEQKYSQNLINNCLFVNNNSNQFSKTFSSFYKKNNRSHTPILRTANNKPIINLPNNNNNKINSKIKRQSKSPILGKSFNFKRKKFPKSKKN